MKCYFKSTFNIRKCLLNLGSLDYSENSKHRATVLHISVGGEHSGAKILYNYLQLPPSIIDQNKDKDKA